MITRRLSTCNIQEVIDTKREFPVLAWNETKVFQSVYISKYGSIAWGDEMELCADALYLKLTGKKVTDIMPGLSTSITDA